MTLLVIPSEKLVLCKNYWENRFDLFYKMRHIQPAGLCFRLFLMFNYILYYIEKICVCHKMTGAIAAAHEV